MSIELIKKALGDQSSLIDEVTSIFEANSTNVNRIKELETNEHTLRGDLKSHKDMVREVTGLSELSRDNLQSFVSGADDALKKDNLALQEQIGTLRDEFDGLEGKHKVEVNTMVMRDTLRGLNVQDKVWNDRALGDLTNALLDGASLDGGKFTFKDSEGVTLRNERGNEMTVEDRVVSLQQDEDNYYFRPLSGGGAADSSTPSVKPTTKLQGAISDTLASMGKY